MTGCPAEHATDRSSDTESGSRDFFQLEVDYRPKCPGLVCGEFGGRTRLEHKRGNGSTVGIVLPEHAGYEMRDAHTVKLY